MSLYMSNTISVFDAIVIIERRVRNKSKVVSRIVQDMKYDISEGLTIVHTFEKLKDRGYIDQVSLLIIRSSEKAGNLKAGFEKVYKRLEQRFTRDRELVLKLTYPIIVGVSSLLLTYLLVLLIFPKIIPLFTSLKVPVPKSTLFALQTVEYISKNILPIVVTLLGVFFLIRYWYTQNKTFRSRVHQVLIRLPFVSKILFARDSSQACFAIAILLKSGVTVIDAVMTIRKDVYLEQSKTLFESIEVGLRNGKSISYVLSNDTLYSNSDWMDFVYMGETAGNLANSFEELCNLYEKELEITLSKLSSITEPLLLFCVSLVVLFIALSVVQPMYSIIQYVNP